MTREVFTQSLSADEPSDIWPEALRSLWWDAKDNWEASHEIAQDINSELGYRLHAYLHRKEGDRWNASYWYGRAGLSFPVVSLEKEFEELLEAALTNLG